MTRPGENTTVTPRPQGGRAYRGTASTTPRPARRSPLRRSSDRTVSPPGSRYGAVLLRRSSDRSVPYPPAPAAGQGPYAAPPVGQTPHQAPHPGDRPPTRLPAPTSPAPTRCPAPIRRQARTSPAPTRPSPRPWPAALRRRVSSPPGSSPSSWVGSAPTGSHLGKTGTGVLSSVTTGGLGLWALIDLILTLTGNATDARGRKVVGAGNEPKIAWAVSGAVIVLAMVIGALSPDTSSAGGASTAPAISSPTPTVASADASTSPSPEETTPQATSTPEGRRPRPCRRHPGGDGQSAAGDVQGFRLPPSRPSPGTGWSSSPSTRGSPPKMRPTRWDNIGANWGEQAAKKAKDYLLPGVLPQWTHRAARLREVQRTGRDQCRRLLGTD